MSESSGGMKSRVTLAIVPHSCQFGVEGGLEDAGFLWGLSRACDLGSRYRCTRERGSGRAGSSGQHCVLHLDSEQLPRRVGVYHATMNEKYLSFNDAAMLVIDHTDKDRLALDVPDPTVHSYQADLGSLKD